MEKSCQKVHFMHCLLCQGSRLDSYARYSLWEGGLDYRHGTGHGVGAFLNVHEGKNVDEGVNVTRRYENVHEGVKTYTNV